MSYNIYLRDPVTGKVAEVPGHLMWGGTYVAGCYAESGVLIPVWNTEAHLNITYNYGRYYYEVYEEAGIRIIYGLSGVDSIAVLEKMIAFLNGKYKKGGEWVITKRNKTIYYDDTGREVDQIASAINKITPLRREEAEWEVSEGDMSDYWVETAANAMRPLYQLIALAKMRPDCIWDGD